MADVIVAAEGATFADEPHFQAGIVPGDGVFTLWAYRAGPGRAQRLTLLPETVPARTARDWGVVAEVVPDGEALNRARQIASGWVEGRPPLTLRHTRAHFVQPLKVRLAKRLGRGLALEGASVRALVRDATNAAKEATGSGEDAR